MVVTNLEALGPECSTSGIMISHVTVRRVAVAGLYYVVKDSRIDCTKLSSPDVRIVPVVNTYP